MTNKKGCQKTEEEKFQPFGGGEGASRPLSHGVIILTENYFVLSQCTHLTDGRTEYQWQYLALHTFMHLDNKN